MHSMDLAFYTDHSGELHVPPIPSTVFGLPLDMRISFFPDAAKSLVLLLAVSTISAAANRTLLVGPRGQYKTPCEALLEAQDGDTIEIDAAGNYDGDVCRIAANNLTIRGVNGRAKINAAGKAAEGKAIWIVAGRNTVIENIEFSGCRNQIRNGAGIRQLGTNLTIRKCYFHNNENGILTWKDMASQILIENSEFAHNGCGDGQTHNIYIGEIKRFIMRYCYSHHSIGGQLVKSRAAENQILYNRLTDEGGSNYKLDLPCGGLASVIGNIFQQSPTTTNSNMLAFGAEGPTPGSKLVVVNNTFVNDRKAGTFINVHPMVARQTLIVNNIFSGPGELCSQENAIMLANFSQGDPKFVDRAQFNYELSNASLCIDAGSDLKRLGMEAIIPRYEYVHPCSRKSRTINGVIDIGAYEK
jgi:hypothetical protein